MADRSAKLRLGGFVAAALATLTGLVILFGGAPRLFSSRAAYTVTFGEAPNVAPGTPVRKSGVRIGEVTSVELDPETGQVKVHFQVEKKYLPRTGDEATIFRGLLSGDTSVDFIPKVGPDNKPISPGGAEIPPGTTIQGITPLNPGQLVRQATGVFPSAQDSMARIVASAVRVEQAVPRIERAFDEIAGLARSGREFMPELRKTNDEVRKALAVNDDPDDPDKPGLRTTLAEVRDFLRTAKPLVEDIRRIVRVNEDDITRTVKATRSSAEAMEDVLKPENRQAVNATLKNLQVVSDDLIKAVRLAAIVLDQGEKVLKEVNARAVQSEATFRNLEQATRPFAANSEQITANIAVAADQLAKTLVEVRETLRQVNRSDGTLQKAIADPSLYNNLSEAAGSLNRTLMRAEKIAQDLQVFADKIARRPETIGVGGAVRPSAGLKESPTAPSGTAPLPPVQPVPAYRVPSDLPPKR